MLLSPSVIHYMQGDKVGLSTSKGFDAAILELSRKILESGTCPLKIQVVERDGHWFALNNSQLHVYRCLERQGRCSHVKADVVALSDVPVDVRLLMVLPSDDNDEPVVADTKDSKAEGAEGSETERGYHKLEQAEPTEKTPAESKEKAEKKADDDDDDDSSDFDDSDSECDWSQDGDSSDCDSSNEDGENSSDDERECLL